MTKNRRLLMSLLSGAFLFAVCVACGSSGSGSESSESSDESAEPAADGLTEVPNSHGLRARIPEGVTPNGIGGAAGFHTDDDHFNMTVYESSTSYADARETAQLIAFQRFIREEETADGYVLVYETARLDDQMNPTDEMRYSVAIQRTIGGTTYTCQGTVDTEANTAAVIDACQSLVEG